MRTVRNAVMKCEFCCVVWQPGEREIVPCAERSAMHMSKREIVKDTRCNCYTLIKSVHFVLTRLITVVAAMAKRLECFTGEEEVPLRPWLERFDAVIEAEGKEEKAAAVLRTCLKGDAAEVVRTMSAEDRKDVAKIKAELIAQFDQKDQTLIQKKFYARKLASDETIGKYTRSLRQLAAEGFPKITGEARDELVKANL